MCPRTPEHRVTWRDDGASTSGRAADLAVAVLSPQRSRAKSENLHDLTPVGRLPHPNLVMGFLRKAAGNEDALMPLVPLPKSKGNNKLARIRQTVLSELLEAHPAFAQTLAKNPELRSVIESGVEAIVEPMNSAGSVSASRVLWTMCTSVWQAISLVIGGLCGKLPHAATPMETQMRHLHQVNDDLRAKLSKCRRDYLRELTELRERCRQLEPPVDDALTGLLNEEPVMFFEPFNFVFDELTKEFVSDTVEEKMRLLMLKGWRQVNDEELIGLRRRLEELEVDHEELQALRVRLDEIKTGLPCLCSESGPVDVTDEPSSLRVLQALRRRLDDRDTETRSLRTEAANTAAEMHALHRRIEELEASDTESSAATTPRVEFEVAGCDSEDARVDAELAAASLEIASQRQQIHKLELDLAAALAKANVQNYAPQAVDEAIDEEAPRAKSSQIEASVQEVQKDVGAQKQQRRPNRAVPMFHTSVQQISDRDASGYVELQRLHVALERKHKEVKRKLGRLIERLRESMDSQGRGSELLTDALIYAGLESTPAMPTKRVCNDRVQATCDRLYEDAKRRIARMRARTSQVHVMQKVELEKCCVLAHGQEAVEQKVKHLRGLHQNSMNCANAWHDALESFHSDILKTIMEEDHQVTSRKESENDPARANRSGDSKQIGHRDRGPRASATACEREPFVEILAQQVGALARHTSPASARSSSPEILPRLSTRVDTESVWRPLSKPPTPQRRQSAQGRRCSMPVLPSAHEKGPNIHHTSLTSQQRMPQSMGARPKSQDLAQNQLQALREVFASSHSLASKGWLPTHSEAFAAGGRLATPSSKQRSADGFSKQHVSTPLTAAGGELESARTLAREQSKSLSALPRFCSLHSGTSTLPAASQWSQRTALR